MTKVQQQDRGDGQAGRYVRVDRPRPEVCRVAIDVREKRNALSPDVVMELIPQFAVARDDPAVRSIVLTGTGSVFCSGGDLSSMNDMTREAARIRMARNHEFACMVRESTKPVVSAVEGVAMGGGAGLALLSDVIVAGRRAKIGFPFLRVGLIPDYGLLHTLPRRVGWARARRMILNCEVITGEEALELGLVDYAVGDADVQARAIEIAVSLGRLPQRALSLVKAGFAAFPASFGDDMHRELEGQIECFVGDELFEGVAAFREKRDPDFTRGR